MVVKIRSGYLQAFGCLIRWVVSAGCGYDLPELSGAVRTQIISKVAEGSGLENQGLSIDGLGGGNAAVYGFHRIFPTKRGRQDARWEDEAGPCQGGGV